MSDCPSHRNRKNPRLGHDDTAWDNYNVDSESDSCKRFDYGPDKNNLNVPAETRMGVGASGSRHVRGLRVAPPRPARGRRRPVIYDLSISNNHDITPLDLSSREYITQPPSSGLSVCRDQQLEHRETNALEPTSHSLQLEDHDVFPTCCPQRRSRSVTPAPGTATARRSRRFECSRSSLVPGPCTWCHRIDRSR